MLTPGQLLPLAIEKPAAGGRMIARADGQVVLVSGAIPGERVRARVERVSKSVAFAETVSVDEPSPDRREPATELLCGGSLFAHIAYPRQLSIKSAVIEDAFARIGRVPLPAPVQVAASPETGYRMRARLHVRGRRVGFFREGTHDICDVRATGQLLPATCDTLERFSAAMQSLAVDVVREIELAENVDASDRAIALDTAAAIDIRALERLASTGGLTGLASPSGVHGRPEVIDRIDLDGGRSISLQRNVLAFFQGNRYLLNDLVRHVVSQVEAESALLDLYAGVGLFAISAAVAKRARVTAVEGDRIAAADLDANASASGAEVAALHGSVEDAVVRLKPDATKTFSVIVDPPRTGMSREALEGALRLNAARLIYVSCDVATLARDSGRIVANGYRIARADAFDLFPNTPHVETVVVFSRAVDS